MKLSMAIGVAIAAVVAIPSIAAEGASNLKTLHHRYLHRHSHRIVEQAAISRSATPQVRPPGFAPIVFPTIAPYPNGEGDEDGLSRHIGDCNKGCIGGNPG
jgi:hypothetical protein